MEIYSASWKLLDYFVIIHKMNNLERRGGEGVEPASSIFYDRMSNNSIVFTLPGLTLVYLLPDPFHEPGRTRLEGHCHAGERRSIWAIIYARVRPDLTLEGLGEPGRDRGSGASVGVRVLCSHATSTTTKVKSNQPWTFSTQDGENKPRTSWCVKPALLSSIN